MFFTPFGNRKYEGGKVSFFDLIDKSEMSRILIEGFAIGWGYKIPFGMLYKPKDKALKHGRMIRNDKEVNEILEQMEMRKWTVMSVYLVMPEMTHELEWKVDPTAVPHVPTARKLKHCVIEELPPNCDVVPDVVEIPADMNKGKHVNKTYQSTTNQPTTDRSTTNLPTVDQSTTDQPTTNEGEFEFNEEEYEQDLETERNVAEPSDPSRWWASVTNFCSQGGETNERDDGCIESEDDLASLASDDEEGGVKKNSTKEYNSLYDKETFNFDKGMLFANVVVFRKALKDYFLAQNKDFKYISNDQRRMRAICKGTSCKWLIYASREMVSNTKYSKVSKWSFYRAKDMALAMLEGSVAEQYAILDDYCNQLLATNLGSTAKIKTKMGYCKGILLVAVGIDAENVIFPIAHAVCEKETTDSWSWFCDLLKTDSHLYSNFKKDFPGLLMKQMLWVAASATTIAEFDRRMVEIKEVNVAAYNWLVAKPRTEWTKAYFSEGVKCDVLLNNLCESFNNAITDARDKSIITLLEKLRYWLMCRFQKKRESVTRWNEQVGKNIRKIIEQNKKFARNCLVTRETEVIFQVDCPGTISYAVNLAEKTCCCRRYQLSEIPCGHALACICDVGHEVWNHIHDWYKKDMMLKGYAGVIHPMPGPQLWPRSGLNPIEPPEETNKPGRPKKKRRRDADEPPPANTTKTRRYGQVHKCGNCGVAGHIARKCPTTVTQAAVQPKKRGRPPSINPTEETKKRKERLRKQRLRENTAGGMADANI
uniref:SWIM-type domain-containing protein n=1 Tax=Cannabis sativa TaxID=3483 RepID=A0A803PIN8_CANSA